MAKTPIAASWTANSTSPYADQSYPSGNRPAGGDSALSFSGTLADGEELSISTDGTYNFGSAPSGKAALGFGQGELYTLPLGSLIASHTDPLSGASWVVEGSGRTSVEVSGVRFMQQGGAGAGINYDFGSNIPENTPIFFSSLVRARADAVNQGGSTQWKTYRVRQLQALDGGSENSVYHKTFAADASVADGGELNVYIDSGTSIVYYDGPHPTLDNKITRHDLYLNNATVDSTNATGFGADIRNDGTGRIYGSYDRTFSPIGNSGTGVEMIGSASSNRWRWLFVQDFINFCTNPVTERTDLYWQVGTLARFEIADTDSPLTMTESYVLPTKTLSTSDATVHLWKGMFSDYSGKYLHFYDETGTFQAARAL